MPGISGFVVQIPSWPEHDIVTYEYWAVLVALMLESMEVPFPGETPLPAGANRMLWRSFLCWNAWGRNVWAIV